jgi:hypothetical protein
MLSLHARVALASYWPESALTGVMIALCLLLKHRDRPPHRPAFWQPAAADRRPHHEGLAIATTAPRGTGE